MHKPHDSQRLHIIHSFDAVLYQLHTLSFFLSPTIWAFAFRIVSQVQCAKPRDLDATRTLRFFFGMVLLCNTPIIGNHAIYGAAEGRVVILDFIGMSYVPTRSQLLLLDLLIVILQLILTTIAYETSLLQNNTTSDIQDILLPHQPQSILPSSHEQLPTQPESGKTTALVETSAYIIDLQLKPIITRLRDPPQIASANNSNALLPLPNTTPWPLPAGMRMLIRASSQMRNAGGGDNVPTDGRNRERRIPGSLDVTDN